MAPQLSKLAKASASKGVMKKPAAASSGKPDPTNQKAGPAMKRYKELEAEKGGRSVGDYPKANKVALLDAKIEAYKESGGKGVTFTTGDMKCLYGRWETTQEPQAPEEVRDLWRGVMSKGRGKRKESAKRNILLAAIVDPGFTDTFWKMTESVVHQLDVHRELGWKTEKHIDDIYGAKQWVAMNEERSHKRNRDPDNR